MDWLLRLADFIAYLGMVLFGVIVAITYTVTILLLVAVILVLMAFLCALPLFIVFLIFHWLWVTL